MKTLFAITAAAAFIASPAFAATYNATSAEGSGANHSVWLSALGADSDFRFETPGEFQLGDTTGSLRGEVESETQSGGFFIDFNYTRDLSVYNDNPRFKSENGSSEMADTLYLFMSGGTLTGYGDYAGIDFTASSMPTPADNTFATQVGTTANNKNDNYGLANWFFLEKTAACSNQTIDLCGLNDVTQGDINIDIAPVPLPAAGLMLLAAVGGLGAMKRRKA